MPDERSRVLHDAIARSDHPEVLRLARERRGWSQTELAERFGCHPSLISRYEGRRRPMRDVMILARLADMLALPHAAFGLHDRVAFPRPPGSAPRVGGTNASEEVEDPVRRRTFLKATSVLGGAAVACTTATEALADERDPAAVLAARLEEVLVGGAAGNDVSPVTPQMILPRLAAARNEFNRADYLPLSHSLPRLITAAETTDRSELAAQSYNLVTRVLLKLRTPGLEWISADRALRAADKVADPLILAEAMRMMASVCRRAEHHDRAQELALTAAEILDLTGPVPDPRHLALHGSLLCTASYGAARADNRDQAHDLLDEATATAARLDDLQDVRQRLAANITSHRVSIAHLLGDPAAALRHARTATPIAFPDAEREGRFLVDIALAYQALDKPEHAYTTLREAHRRAPGEVRTRAAARDLITNLLAQQRVTLPDIRQFAVRTHAA